MNHSLRTRMWRYRGDVNLFSAFAIIAVGFRLLLLNPVGYRSTDYEVHRNWMAITYNLPFSEWYLDSTSPWTLDYPTFFALWEKCLAYFAAIVDPNMVVLTNLNYAETIKSLVFQRLTVIAGDLLTLIPGCVALLVVTRRIPYENCREQGDSSAAPEISPNKQLMALLLLACNPGLLLVDHIHFQYNGFLIGLLLWATAAWMDRRYCMGTLIFSVLIYFKHIFAYTAPAAAVFLIWEYCFMQGNVDEGAERDKTKALGNWCPDHSIKRLSTLVLISLGVTVVALGPIVVTGQFSAFLKRLFPFGRGLVHAYWAPNVWALYTGIDRFLSKGCAVPLLGGVLERMTLCRTARRSVEHHMALASPTTGHVGHVYMTNLPDISPKIAFWILFMFGYIPLIGWGFRRMMRGASKVDRQRSRLFLPILLGISNYAGFLFGWHAHEKAILYTTLMMSLPVRIWGSATTQKEFFFLNYWANFSLLPLLPEPADFPLKCSLWLLGAYLDYMPGFMASKGSRTTLNYKEKAELLLPIGLAIYQTFPGSIHDGLFRGRGASMQFLPLMLTSMTSAVAIMFHVAYVVKYYTEDITTLTAQRGSVM